MNANFKTRARDSLPCSLKQEQKQSVENSEEEGINFKMPVDLRQALRPPTKQFAAWDDAPPPAADACYHSPLGFPCG